MDEATSGERLRGVLLVALAAVAVGYLFADFAPLIPLLSADLGIDEVQVGLLATASAAVYTIGTLATTGLPDRYGPKPVIAAGLATGVVGVVLIATAPSYPVVLVGKGVQGLASAFTFVSGARYIAGLYGSRRSHFALGMFGAGYPLGGALALALMPRFATALGDWRGAFWAEAGLIAACLGLWLMTIGVAPVPRRGSIRDALRCPNCWWAGIQHTGFGVVTAAGAWIAVFLLRAFDLPLAVAGGLGALLLLVATLARPLGGWLVARHWLRTRPIMAAANIFIIVGVLLLAIPDRPLAVALLGAVIFGVGGGIPYAAVFNTAAASLRNAPGAAQGMPVMLGNVVILAVAPSVGFLVRSYGFSAAWLFIAALAAAALGGLAFTKGEEDLT